MRELHTRIVRVTRAARTTVHVARRPHCPASDITGNVPEKADTSSCVPNARDGREDSPQGRVVVVS